MLCYRDELMGCGVAAALWGLIRRIMWCYNELMGCGVAAALWGLLVECEMLHAAGHKVWQACTTFSIMNKQIPYNMHCSMSSTPQVDM